ncbi:MAG: hypothetical protein NT159_00620 [Proteobacteria bacterium]|nr:hypothetical protein [Pseudomonadota bacterium]
MSSTSFQVVYDGPALSGSTIDVRELAPALLAFGDLIEQANITLNSGRASVALRVNASFKSGCFGIDFSVVQSLVDQALSLFKEPGVVSAKELAEELGFVYEKVAAVGLGLLGIIKWLRNRKIKKVVLLDNGRARIEVDGDSIETERITIELLRNFKLRQALQKAITEPLEKDGFDSVAISTKPEDGFIVIGRNERQYFVAPPADEEELADETVNANLQLVSVSFKGDNKWRFFDGTNSFYALISDDQFVHKVQMSEENFAAGDILNVSLRKRQWLEADVMKSEYEVLKVIKHRRGMAQLPMPFSENGDTADPQSD